MSNGALELGGSLAVAQFWPNGGSDADTVTITPPVDGAPFRFRSTPDAVWQETRVFDGAIVDGAVKKAPIRAKRKLTVRLIGVDAPELHCGASARIKKAKQTAEQQALFKQYGAEYRQPLAESAVLALTEWLGGPGATLPCVVRTRVDLPNEVFDCYGRLVGDLFVDTEAGELHVNRWLMEQGWAVPSLYDSMSRDEIEPIVDAANAAYATKRGIWKSLGDTVTELDWDMRYRRLHAAPVPDEGVVLYPKYYRRLVTWAVNKRTKMGNGTFLAWPEEIVFKEKNSTLIGADGKRVVGW